MRKIMIEVTPQEYEKIQAGKLNVKDLTVEELVNQLVKKIGEPCKTQVLHDDYIRMSRKQLETYEHEINDKERFELTITKELPW